MTTISRVVEKGLVLELDGKFWGVTYRDGQCTCHGWVDIKSASMSDPRYCHKPSDKTYVGSPNIPEMNKGKLVAIKRVTTFELDED